MVRVAIAGGSGQVAQEIIDALLSTNKHHLTILSRNEAPESSDHADAIQWKTVDYNDIDSLANALKGTHTLLSFVQLLSDPDQKAQKNLINAAIAAGVQRFAPSEYGSKGIVNMPWWHGKGQIREYLEEVNGNGEVLNYTLFQPGLFLNYLAYPHKTTKHIDPLQSVFDLENRRAIIVDGHEDAIMTLTTVADLAAIVARAVDYEGRWPAVGGIQGNRVTFSQIVEIASKIRGPIAVDKVKIDDLEAGRLNTTWNMTATHHAVSEDDAGALLKAVSIGVLLSSTKGAWDISDDFNKLFPDHEFSRVEDFLATVWGQKP